MDEEKKKQINDGIQLLIALCEEYCDIDGNCYKDCPMHRNCHCGELICGWWEID